LAATRAAFEGGGAFFAPSVVLSTTEVADLQAFIME